TSYTYDQNDNVLTTTEGTNTITRDYDDVNRVTTLTAQGSSGQSTIGYTHDKVGNLTTLTYPGGKQVFYEYDKANRLTTVTAWGGKITKYEYNKNGWLTKTTRPDLTVETRTYYDNGSLKELKDVDRDGKIILQHSYTYNKAGEITQEQNASEAAFALKDAAMTYTTDNRIATFNGKSVTYDADGNMTHGPLSGDMSSFTYDSKNRLTSAGNTTYTYDAEGNRTAVTENGNTTRYAINPNAPLSQVLIKTDSQGNQTYYIYGLGLIAQEEAGVYKTYHFDKRGSTVALTDINGAITDTFQYSVYGELVKRNGTTSTPFLFNGMFGVMTDSNGLYYMRARYYNPEIKRFINQDVLLGSIANGQSLNRYAYVNGNPVSYVDPFGLALRAPDYYVFEFSVGPEFVGVGPNIIVDRYGNVYGGGGVSGGISVPSVFIGVKADARVSVGWLAQDKKPSPEELRKHLEGFGVTHSAGAGPGASVNWSPDNGTVSVELGLYTPQVQVGVDGTWLLIEGDPLAKYGRGHWNSPYVYGIDPDYTEDTGKPFGL
ncbi:MAG TPA: RHS repeat-associated core domain-containing protein, partial [Anaerolineae bacterium]|nr:RHS repeat-associated core domain-containing protein [Anaerolineae bacterium]